MEQNLVSLAIRDTRRDAQYFAKYLNEQHADIAKYHEKLAATSDYAKRQRILLHFVWLYHELLIAEFSAGADRSKLITLLDQACQIALLYDGLSYEELLLLMSLSVMLGYKGAIGFLITKNGALIVPDRLLNYLAGVIVNGRGVWDRRIRLWPEYAMLDYVFMASGDMIEQYRALCRYLLGWYYNHANDAWFDSLNSDENIYCGYWSFEAAAVAISLGMSDADFKGVEYYPAL